MDLKINSNFDKIVIVDPGKNAVKVLVFTPNYELEKYFSFPSKSKKKRNFYDIDGGSEHQFKVELDNLKYMVGEGIADNYNFETTKNNLHHKLCIYTAIANVVTKENEKIHLVVGYPSSDYVNTAQRQDYENLIRADKPVSMVLNNETKTFKIVSIAVYPEGIALKPRIKHANKKVRSIDIGGQNINFRDYDAKGNTLMSYSLDEAGINHLEEYIKKELRRFVKADKVSIDAIDTIQAIKNCEIVEVSDVFLNNYKTTKEFMENTIYDFIEKNIIGQLITKGANIYQRGNFLIFTGGGSLLIQRYLEDVLENNEGNMYFSNTAKWDNCISYAIKDLGDRCKKVGKIKEAQLIGQKILKQTDLDEISLLSEV